MDRSFARSFAVVIVWLMVLSGSAIVAARQSASAAEQEVLQAEHQRCAAMVAADVVTLSRLLAPGLTYVHSSGLLQDKSAFLTSVKEERPKFLAVTPADMQVRVVGDVAVVTGVIAQTTLVTGRPERSYKIRYTDVHVRRGGNWELIAYHAAPVPLPQ